MLRIHNTLTKQKEAFQPLTPNVVRIYSCGLTVYAPMHIGHARTYCFWDVVRRYLEYRSFHVFSVINYTDVDDRIIAKQDATTGCLDVAELYAARFRRDCRALRIKDYAVYTRATDFTAAQIQMIRELLRKGHAYVVDGEVFYDVESFPGYGKLSGRKLEEQEAGASGRIQEDLSRKKNPADFTLWKPAKPGEPSWETGEKDWPSGRPGWHIECSAMSTEVHGAHFDIHGGAVDNLFPHHENEVAQSEPLCGEPWVKYWMHPEHLDLSGVKMSKSLGNVISVPQVLETFRTEELRWFFAQNHYRSKVGYTDEIVSASAEGFRRIARLVKVLEQRLLSAGPEKRRIPVAGAYATLRPGDDAVPRLRHRFTHGRYGAESGRLIGRFIEAMDDDIGTPRATAAVFDYVSELYSGGIEDSEDWPSVASAYQCLTRHLHVLGVEMPNEELFPELAADSTGGVDADELVGPYKKVLDRLVTLRSTARKEKDFKKSDLIRDVLAEAGVILEDKADGTRWLLRD